ncbi:MAG: ABC transporter substrate-binding protein [Legionellaceae bacterium]|nr:ABC transporter substrate-binding protein [Legionellaceae bacterium]
MHDVQDYLRGKKFSYFLLIVLFLIFAVYSLSYANSPKKICLTGRIVENIDSYGKSFQNAAQLALEDNISLKDHIKLEYYFYDNKPLEPIHIYQKMIHDNCSAIVGFEYLSDLLLIIKEQKNTQIPIFTSYASFKADDKIPSNIFVFMPSYNKHVSEMIVFLKKHFNGLDNIALITEVNREEMLKYQETYSSEFQSQKLNFDTFNFLDNDPNFLPKLKKFIGNKKYRFIFLLSGATTSAKIVDFVNSPDALYIGTENFGSSVSPSFYTRLSNRNVNAYFIRNIDYVHSSPELDNYRKKYTEKYQTLPTILAAYTYDAVNIILQAYKDNGAIDTSSIYKINHFGITGAYIRDGAFHPSDNFMILSVHKDGYHHEA